MTDITDTSLSAFIRGLPIRSSKQFTPFAEYDPYRVCLNVHLQDCSKTERPLNPHQREIDVFLKNHPHSDEDRFVGFRLWINPVLTLEEYYRQKFGYAFPLFRYCHNSIKRKIEIRDVVYPVISQHPDIVKTWGQWKPYVDYVLNTYTLRVHIPLKVFPRA